MNIPFNDKNTPPKIKFCVIIGKISKFVKFRQNYKGDSKLISCFKISPPL